MIMPNNYVCLIAGAVGHVAGRCSPSSTSPARSGAWLLLQIVGDVFSGPIDWFLDLVAQYRIPLLVISVVVVAVMAGGELRRGRKEIEGLQELEHSADPDAPPVPNHPYDPEHRPAPLPTARSTASRSRSPDGEPVSEDER